MATYRTWLDHINDHADLIIRALDVGGGDSLLIQTKHDDKDDNKNYLIDTGGSGTNEKTKTLLWNALQNYKVEKLDAIIITHPHVDHDGNLLFLLEKEAEIKANKESVEAAGEKYTGPEFSITTVYTNGISISTASSKQYQYKYKLSLDGRYDSLYSGKGLTLDSVSGVTWTTLWPPKDFIKEMQRRTDNHITEYGSIGDKADDDGGGSENENFLEGNGYTYSINNSSIVGKLVKGEFSMLFTGDAGNAVWSRNLSGSKVSKLSYCIDGTALQVKVYKAAHHSQNAANLQGVIQSSIKPEAFVITGGDHQNPYRYPGYQAWNAFIPRIATLAKISTHGVSLNNTWCTRFHGDIHIGVFGSEYIIYPSTQDYIWKERWTDLINKSIKLTSTKNMEYLYNGITLATVSAS